MSASVRFGRVRPVQLLLAGGFLLMLALPSRAQFSLSGTFDVLPNGAATYTMPLRFPEGVVGFQPELALTYNSYAGDGPLGVGWSLSGFSRISRCPKSIFIDGDRSSAPNFDTVNFDANDRYCLDGKRLIKVDSSNGTDSYKLEFDDLSKITSTTSEYYTGGPAAFKVITKDGLTVEFTPFKLPNTSFAYEWVANRVTDRRGNMMYLTYETSGAAYGQVSRIQYTSNYTNGNTLSSNMMMNFFYNQRPAHRTAYKSGQKINYSGLLSKISMHVGVSHVKDIIFSYNLPPVGGKLSTLASIKECAPSGNCLVPITFKSNTVTPSLQRLSASGAAAPKLQGVTLTYASFYSMDVNQDGASDIVAMYPTSDYQVTSTAVWFSDKNGGFTNSGVISNIGGWAGDRKYFTFDVNDDDKTDIVEIYQCGSDACVTSWLSNGLGSFNKASVASSVISGWGGGRRFFVYPSWAVSRGDQYIATSARAGLMVLESAQNGAQTLVRHVRSLGDGSFGSSQSGYQSSSYIDEPWGGDRTQILLDANGDGFPDIVNIDLNGTINEAWAQTWLYDPSVWGGRFVKNPTLESIGWFWDAEWHNAGKQRFYAADMNGDGLQDIVGIESPDTCTGTQVCVYGSNLQTSLSRGNGSFEKLGTYKNSGSITGSDGSGVRQYLVDVDGDGLSEVIQRHNKHIATFNFDVGGVYKDKTLLAATNDVELVLDADANGLPDIALINRSSGAVDLYGYKSNVKSIVREIDNGLGSRLLIEADNSPVYFNSQIFLDRSLVFPLRNILPNAWMTFASEVQAGNGLSLRTKYNYGYPLVQLGSSGRGYLGVRWFGKTTDNGSGFNGVLNSKTFYHQNYPFVGRAERQTLGFGISFDNLTETSYEYGWCYHSSSFNVNMGSSVYNNAGCGVTDYSYFSGNYFWVELSKSTELAKDISGKSIPGKISIFDYYVNTDKSDFGRLKSSLTKTLNPDGSLSGYSVENYNTYEVDAGGFVKLKSATVTNVKP